MGFNDDILSFSKHFFVPLFSSEDLIPLGDEEIGFIAVTPNLFILVDPIRISKNGSLNVKKNLVSLVCWRLLSHHTNRMVEPSIWWFPLITRKALIMN